MEITKEIIEKVSALVAKEYLWDVVEDQDYGTQPENAHDSFGDFDLTTVSEPEDATWNRDLSENFYVGLKIGIRNTLKVLKEHPELLTEITKN